MRSYYPCLNLCLFAVLSGVLPASAQEQMAEVSTPAFAHVDSAPIREMSGIVKSLRRDNLYWVHNDSGDSARIFAITEDGKAILPTYSKFTAYGEVAEQGKQQWEGFEVLYAENTDWEDIARDENYLYLADTGNNANKRRDLAIYAISEIDPTASTRSAVVQKYLVSYPEQQEFPPGNWEYDCESLFVADGSLYLLTKHRETGKPMTFQPGANLYRLDTRHTDRSNTLTLVDSFPLLLAATGADLSPDGQTLAVVSYTDLWLFDRPPSGDHWLSSSYRRIPLNRSVFRQLEAVTWQDQDTLLLGNEQRDLFKISVSQLAQP